MRRTKPGAPPQQRSRTQLTPSLAARAPRPQPLAAQELGAAALSKRPTSCMLILPKPPKAGAAGDAAEAAEFDEAYAEIEKKVKASEVV